MNVGTLKKLLESVDDGLIVCFYDVESPIEFPVELDEVTAPCTEEYYSIGEEMVEGRVMLLGRSD